MTIAKFMFKYPIAISLSPNTEKEDVYEAVKTLFQPWRWKKGKALAEVKKWFKDYFGVRDVYLFNSGRSALYAILQAFGIKEGDEVLIQAFTCVAVPDPIIWTGARPVFVDIDSSLNIDAGLLEKHINPKTKAIIVQHTFGIPAKIDLIKKIAQKYRLILIEDCAHSLGASYQGKKIGTFGDVSFFSFGRDKVISSVFGGAGIISSKFKVQSSKLKENYKKMDYPGYFWIFQQLFHPLAFLIVLPLYNLNAGKLILYIFQKLNLLSKPVSCKEMKGERPSIFPLRYPNGLACLLLKQLDKLMKYNQARRKQADYYYQRLNKIKGLSLPRKIDGSVYLRFNILTDREGEVLTLAKKRKILLGKWYKNIIDPPGVDLEKIGYRKDSCLFAEKTAKLSVNLPTYPKLNTADLREITNLLTGLLTVNDTRS